MAENTQEQEYGAESITVLEGLDPVRKRPGMYIGSTSSQGLHHLIWEVVDNGIDEAMAGHADTITIKLLPDGIVSVEDNGRGIPVSKHKITGLSALETVLTKLHAGGKFGGGGYKVSGGLHGVGVSVVNALSSYLRAEIQREGKIWMQEFKKGDSQGDIITIGDSKKTGTTIIFQPDDTIFTELEFKWNRILDRMRQQAYLTKNITINIFDLRKKDDEKKYRFYFEGGIKSYVKALNHGKSLKNETIFYVGKEYEENFIELAIQYNDEYNENVLPFTNNIYNPDGGTHLIGFKTALTRTLNSYARSKNLIKEKDENLTGEDVREGLTAVISLKLQEPQFEGQTKGKLGNAEIKSQVDKVMGEALMTFLEEHPKEAEAIIGKCMLSAQARIAARTARASILRKGALDGMTLPGKLSDCSSRKAADCEIYIVEGDSAGGSAKQGRDRKFQAILPLRGKILNVERARLDKMLANTEIKNLVIALGTNIDDQLDIEKLRYHRIIIMTDADVDGAHIRTLLLTLFFRHFAPLITNGYLYVAQPPLYRIQKGTKVKYAYSDEEKVNIIKEFGGGEDMENESHEEIETDVEEASDKEEEIEENVEETTRKHNVKLNVQRYKGLGEMNPEQLWETTMNPETRLMKQISINDAEKADKTFEMLMGDHVPSRKHFIQTHAKSVQNLDT
ncbi:DNA topoisomerase (ATP-hydrolyzing) subunit B [Patescibacteria group bacterium]|nr:DNA topoisomerase (ATP-hydrolyzing) subunit B [Patescibacteria group bacterium]